MKKGQRKIRNGDILFITVLDHCQGPPPIEPLSFEVYGRVVEIKPGHISVASWIATDHSLDSNTEIFVVLRSAILEARILK